MIGNQNLCIPAGIGFFDGTGQVFAMIVEIVTVGKNLEVSCVRGENMLPGIAGPQPGMA